MSATPPTDARSDSPEASFGKNGLKSRALSTIGLWLAVIGVVYWGEPLGFALLVGSMTVLGTWEFLGIARHAGQMPMLRSGILLSAIYTAALYFLLIRSAHQALPLLDSMAIIAVVMVSLFLHLGRPVDGRRPALAIALAVFAFVYLAFGMSFVGRLVFFDYPGTGKPSGAWLALWLAAVTKFTDMGAYLVGSAIGKHKLIPHISPGKTREGLLGALLFSQLAGCGLFAAFPAQLALLGEWPQVVLLGLVLAVAAVIGDLAESLLKRSLEVKDSGHTLPGIGGIMDLTDSLIFTAPLLYFYLQLTQHVPTIP